MIIKNNALFLGSISICFILTLFGLNFQFLGIIPRSLEFYGIFTSWLIHKDLSHFSNNLSVLFILITAISFLENKSTLKIILLICVSGFFTWLLGSNNSIHIGASGLIFALFGFLLISTFIQKSILYVIVGLFIFYFYAESIFIGLIPDQNVSFAAHFGGFISGILLKMCYNK